jgi:hypothetical protein
MYECATGLPPFTAANFTELSSRINSGEYTPATSHNPQLSKRLDRIIERAMSLEPAKRFKDLRELGRELLLLAGQRTRITWGLSFGEAKPTLSSGPGGYAPGVSAPPPRTSVTDAGDVRRAVVRRRALAVAPLVLLGAGLVGWYAGAFHRAAKTSSANVRPQVAHSEPLAVNSESAPTAVAKPPEAPGLPEHGDTPWIPIAVPVAAPTPEPVATAKRPSTPARDAHTPRTTADQTSGSSRSRAAAGGGRKAAPVRPASDQDADWMLPPANVRPASGDPDFSANGAPIFD